MKVYEGKEPFIFVSYAHKDSKTVVPILEAMAKKGFRIWYDTGIELGTEWPEFIAKHLADCDAVVAFVSPLFDASHNCRREINFAIARKKTTVAVYLEEFAMSLGMELQLGTLQSMFYTRHETLDSFVDALADAKELQNCRGDAPVLPKKEEASSKPDPTSIEEEENPFRAAFGGLKSAAASQTATSSADFVIKNGVLKKYIGKSPNVTIPNGVRVIGEFAFGQWLFSTPLLESVTIPPSVEKIEACAFVKCSGLRSVTMPDSVIEMGGGAFRGCTKLENLTLSKGLTEIAPSAFSGCSALRYVMIPATVKKIGAFAFSDCKMLTAIDLPASVKKIESWAFQNCRALSIAYLRAPDVQYESDSFPRHTRLMQA